MCSYLSTALKKILNDERVQPENVNLYQPVQKCDLHVLQIIYYCSCKLQMVLYHENLHIHKINKC